MYQHDNDTTSCAGYCRIRLDDNQSTNDNKIKSIVNNANPFNNNKNDGYECIFNGSKLIVSNVETKIIKNN
jgi:hypothetical protein